MRILPTRTACALLLSAVLLASCLGEETHVEPCLGDPCLRAGDVRVYRIAETPTDRPCHKGLDGSLSFRIQERRGLRPDSFAVG